MHYWKTAFLTLLIFGLGGVAGGLITAQVIKGKIERVQTSTLGREAGRPEFIPQYLGALQRQISLTPDQVQRIREIVMRSHRENVRARDEFRLRSRNAIERSDHAIMEILTDDQKEQFEEFRKKRRAMFQNQQRPLNGLPPLRPGDRPGEWMGDGPGGRPGMRPQDRPPPPGQNRPPQAPQAQPQPQQFEQPKPQPDQPQQP